MSQCKEKNDREREREKKPFFFFPLSLPSFDYLRMSLTLKEKNRTRLFTIFFSSSTAFSSTFKDLIVPSPFGIFFSIYVCRYICKEQKKNANQSNREWVKYNYTYNNEEEEKRTRERTISYHDCLSTNAANSIRRKRRNFHWQIEKISSDSRDLQ